MQVKPRGGRWTGRFQWTHLICLLRALPFQVLELVQSIRVQQVAQAFPFGVELISAHPLPVTFPRWASPSFRRVTFALWPQNRRSLGLLQFSGVIECESESGWHFCIRSLCILSCAYIVPKFLAFRRGHCYNVKFRFKDRYRPWKPGIIKPFIFQLNWHLSSALYIWSQHYSSSR